MKINSERTSLGVQVNISPETIRATRETLKTVADAAWEALAPVAVVVAEIAATPAILLTILGERITQKAATGRQKAVNMFLTATAYLTACTASLDNPTMMPPLPAVETRTVSSDGSDGSDW